MIRVLEYNDKSNAEIKKLLLDRKSSENNSVIESVKQIISDVKVNKDEALYRLTKKFDSVDLESLKVSEEEITIEASKVSPELVAIMKEAKENIRSFHEKAIINSWCDYKPDGSYMGQRVIPLKRVGIYVPGGTAVYPSSVLMNVIPAQVAGVEEIVMVTPPGSNGKISPIVASVAQICDIHSIYKVGGAQAVAALAYGTQTIDKVDKIVGPGNIFVAEAKKQVYGEVDIDMIAGPSEILIVADKNANPKYVAADLLSQAEHDKLASSILITDSKEVLDKTIEEIEDQINTLSRKEIMRSSVDNFGACILCNNLNDAVELANYIAPEHLEIMTENASEMLGSIRNAGSVFLGYSTPEPIGDYFGGPNHILPTLGTARFFSPLSTESFLKKSSFIYYSKSKLKEDGEKIIKFAESESLTAHANSVRVRMENE